MPAVILRPGKFASQKLAGAMGFGRLYLGSRRAHNLWRARGDAATDILTLLGDAYDSRWETKGQTESGQITSPQLLSLSLSRSLCFSRSLLPSLLLPMRVRLL